LVETAVGGALGLEVLKTKGSFAVVMSDLRMPEISGVDFLAKARLIAPDATRVLLTGYGDVDSAIAAVNDGNIFRFLTKPCATEILVKALVAAADQHRLITSEKVLLEQTLRGSIKTLTEILALANPAAFGRATRIRQSLSELMGHFQIKETWAVEVAAMLSQIGYVTLPPKTQEKLYQCEPLTPAEQDMIDRVPQVTDQLLMNIPRLELVREILHLHQRKFGGERTVRDSVMADSLPWGARALKIALDFDLLASAPEKNHSIEVLCSRVGWYDPTILKAFVELRGATHRAVQIRETKLRDIQVGMTFDEDIRSSKGVLLIARGQEVTPSLLERVRNFSQELGIREPIRVVVSQVKN
jgi:response regulator RpfG family c-di-GMP phosphodiesterase